MGTKLVFNCQMGRGRTTTGMVVATLIHLRRIGATGSSQLSKLLNDDVLIESLRNEFQCMLLDLLV